MKLLQIEDYLLLIDEGADLHTEPNGTVYLHKEDEYEFLRTKTKDSILGFLLDGTKIYYKIIAYRPLTKEAEELDLPLLPNPFEIVDVNVQTRNFNKQVKNPFLVEEKEYQVWERAYIEGFNDGLVQSKQLENFNELWKKFGSK